VARRQAKREVEEEQTSLTKHAMEQLKRFQRLMDVKNIVVKMQGKVLSGVSVVVDDLEAKFIKANGDHAPIGFMASNPTFSPAQRRRWKLERPFRCEISPAQKKSFGKHANVTKNLAEVVQLRDDRKEEKAQQYWELAQGFGYFSLNVIAAAADLGAPGLGSVANMIALSGTATARSAKLVQAAAAEIGGGAPKMLTKCATTMAKVEKTLAKAVNKANTAADKVRAAVEDPLEQVAGQASAAASKVASEASAAVNGGSASSSASSKKGLLGRMVDAAIETTVDEVKGGLEEAGQEAGQTALEAAAKGAEDVVTGKATAAEAIKHWKEVVHELAVAAAEAVPDILMTGGKEGAFAAAGFIPLLGPYVGLAREAGQLLDMFVAARQAGKAFVEKTDRAYGHVLSMRDCSLSVVTTFLVDPEALNGHGRAGGSKGSSDDVILYNAKGSAAEARRLRKRVDASSVAAWEDTIQLKGVLSGALSAVRTNWKLRSSMAETFRSQDVWFSPFAPTSYTRLHTDLIASRMAKTIKRSVVDPETWLDAIGIHVINACHAYNSIPEIKGTDEVMCCDEICDKEEAVADTVEEAARGAVEGNGDATKDQQKLRS
jgi:hypothetical protein